MDQKQPLNFNAVNIRIAKELAKEGLTHKQIARRLNKFFYTAVKHKKLTNKTITNLLQSEKQAYTDADAAHNTLPADAEKIIDEALSMAPEADEVTTMTPIERNKAKSEAALILESNLPDDLKIKLLTPMLTH